MGEVLFKLGVADAMPKGSLFIDMASIQPREAREACRQVAGCWVCSISTPRLRRHAGRGSRHPGHHGGRRSGDFERAQPVFAALGRSTHVGPHGAGQLAKLANQMIVGITIGAVAEELCCWPNGAAPTPPRYARLSPAALPTAAFCNTWRAHGQARLCAARP
ncbi:NAD(P)-dependent oxidoreductase [Staphylococcus epidermidis]|nr:NAD(P)-dependent oxidoreductase [Staphylococcus epidermidis]